MLQLSNLSKVSHLTNFEMGPLPPLLHIDPSLGCHICQWRIAKVTILKLAFTKQRSLNARGYPYSDILFLKVHSPNFQRKKK